MAEDDHKAGVDSDHDEENFVAPAIKTIDDMITAGKEDESLKTYMDLLLGRVWLKLK